MSRALKVKYIVEHCTAGFGGISVLQSTWKNLGWKTAGYSAVIETNGTIWWLTSDGWNYTKDVSKADLSKVTNGVGGWNSLCVHFAYIGGIDSKGKGKDTRTPEQKDSEHVVIKVILEYLKNNGKDITKNIGFLGHNNFSEDKNNNGKIDSWERFKECPSFDVMESDNHYLYSSKDMYKKLPKK